MTRLPPNKRNVNIVFQDYALFPHMDVAKNIAFGLELQGLDAAAHPSPGHGIARAGATPGLCQALPSELSGGQRQRVALMRALAPDPQVLLLDEPLSALDAKLRQQMQIELKSIQEKTGKTFLFVTHDQEEALTMSDQIVVMNNGKIEQMGDPDTLYGRPGSVFVANFIGETNLLRSTVVGIDGNVAALNWNGITIKAESGRACAKDRGPYLCGAASRSDPLLGHGADERQPDQGKIRQRVFKGNHTSLIDRGRMAARFSTLWYIPATSPRFPARISGSAGNPKIRRSFPTATRTIEEG